MPGGLRVHFHRPLPDGKILAIKFKRDVKGWCVCFAMRAPCAVARESNRQVGVDVGVSVLATLSTGEVIPNLMVVRSSEKTMRRAQRALARCKRGSNRRKKARARLAKAHGKIASTRRTYLHQVSAKLVREYDVVAVEKLQIKNMMKNPHLARSIMDAGWGMLVEMLCYKAVYAGAKLIEVNPRFTSQDCSACGVRVPKKLAQRTHHCPHCGLVLCRDVNAARNILARGGTASLAA